jgi:hypothetical protein
VSLRNLRTRLCTQHKIIRIKSVKMGVERFLPYSTKCQALRGPEVGDIVAVDYKKIFGISNTDVYNSALPAVIVPFESENKPTIYGSVGIHKIRYLTNAKGDKFRSGTLWNEFCVETEDLLPFDVVREGLDSLDFDLRTWIEGGGFEQYYQTTALSQAVRRLNCSSDGDSWHCGCERRGLDCRTFADTVELIDKIMKD